MDSLPEKPEIPSSFPTEPFKPRRRYVLEKFMGLLTVFFFGGIIVYSVIPDESIRGMSLGLFSLLMMFLLYKFGV